jgi:hypothetical protein
LAYDEARQAAVLFGGTGDNVPGFADTWVWTASPVPTSLSLSQPVCPSGTAAFTVTVIGNGPFSFRWQVQTATGWADLIDGDTDIDGPTMPYASVQGSSAETLLARRSFRGDHPVPGSASFRCRVGNACGTIITSPVRLITCIADFNCSGSLTVQDIFDYLQAWFAGAAEADVNGSGVSVQDIFDYLGMWFTGCG